MNLQSLTALRKYVSLSSHKEGTIKIKVALSALNDPKVKEVIAEFKSYAMPKAILDKQINIFTQTITLKYDTSVITPQDFEDLLTTKDEAKFLALAEKYHAILIA